MGKSVRWGVLSTARIGQMRVIPAIGRSETGLVAAIASRDEAKARSLAATLGIGKAYGSYEALLADPDIDAIYNPLPNHLHVPMTLKAVAAGKHVLCEKPIAMSAGEARSLLSLPQERLVAEAFMVRAHPQWLRAREILRSGELGEVRAIQCFFSYFNVDAGNIRNKVEVGGGGILDIGCYALVAGRFFFEADPQRVVALTDRDPVMGVDRLTTAIMDFGHGRRLDFTISTQLVPFQRLQLVGTRKRLELEIPFNAPQGEAVSLLVDDGSKFAGQAARRETLEPADQYAEMIDVFDRAVLGEVPLPYGPGDAVRNMAALDALVQSEQSGGWVVPAYQAGTDVR